MRILRRFVQGKTGDNALCEDRIVVADHFIALLDGATPKTCPKIDGKSAGLFATEIAAAEILLLDKDISAHDAVRQISAGFRDRVAKAVTLPEHAEGPATTLTIYSVARREVWRVGDGPFMVDGALHAGDKAIDRLNAEMRSLMIELALASGMTLEDITKQDIGRETIMPALSRQHLIANRDHPYGFGDIDGRPVPDKFIEVFDAKGAKTITLATDGYPALFETLEETEAYLARVLKDDPMLYKLHKSTKGVQTGNVSFDDRSYLQFAPEL